MTETTAEIALAPAQKAAIVLSTLVLFVLVVVPPPEGLAPAAWKTLGIALIMAFLWATETIPIAATALIPLVAFPLLGIAGIKDTAAPYAHPLIFLFLGGFLIAQGLQRWDLHRRIALSIAVRAGDRPDLMVLGFMVATAFLSMWVSNTATAMMMTPIAASVTAVASLTAREDEDLARFAIAMMLGIAYAASIGGIGTLIGTPPNALLAAFFDQAYGLEISFASWMLFAIPVVIVLLPLTWAVLTKLVYRFQLHSVETAGQVSGGAAVQKALDDLGRLTTAEKRVAIVFVLAAGLWVTRPLLTGLPFLSELSDTGIAIFCGLLLFMIPAGRQAKGQALLTWNDAVKLPWGVLLLFGGGLTLADAISGTGLAAWLGDGLGRLEALPFLVFVLAVAGLVIFLTELTSNTATVAAFLPIIAVLADSLGIAPIALAAPAAMAASCAFMLPVATPPNAIIFSTGQVTIPQMVRAGFVMNLVGLGIVGLAGAYLAPLVFG